jgi:FRG domain
MALALSKVRSLGEFTEQVRQIRADWTVSEDKELWFRGEKRDYGDTRLRPILYRPPRNRSLRPVGDLLKIEDCLFESFQRCNAQLTEAAFDVDDFDGYLLMQHHGGPTRLLDWSDGSLMALHFALRNKQGDETDSVVYVLEPSRLMDTLDALPDTALREQKWTEHVEAQSEDSDEDSSNVYLPSSDGSERDFELPTIPMLLRFPLFSRRVAAQRSQFIVFGSVPSWLSEETSKPDSSICLITIDGRHTKAIRAELRECGVTESVIFPDLDGLGRELTQLWEDRQ